MRDEMDRESLCVIGDTHGHLQLALCMAARWQSTPGCGFEAVFLCGDVGTFTRDDQLDSATRRRGKANPCELEFLQQWALDPQPPWLARIFRSLVAQGLGLECPVAMVHGNHEGFAHLETLTPAGFPDHPIPMADLPAVDPGGQIRYLPSGWRCVTPSGRIVAGVGGMERGQRLAEYHPMAYLDDEAVLHLLGVLPERPADVLITHQGPARLQGEKGSATLDLLLDAPVARNWFHGHAIANPAIVECGATTVVPLGDVAFSDAGDPGEDAWSCLAPEGVRRERPAFWREYRRRRWRTLADGRLLCPDLESKKGQPSG